MHAGVHLCDVCECIIRGVTSVNTEHSAPVFNVPVQRGNVLLLAQLTLIAVSPPNLTSAARYTVPQTYITFPLYDILHLLSFHSLFKRSNHLN